MKTIQVDLGTPSKFYHGKKRLSANNAYALYTQGAVFNPVDCTGCEFWALAQI